MNFNGNAIHKCINKEVPATLWHYTSVQGFHGIIESGSIYATDPKRIMPTCLHRPRFRLLQGMREANEEITGG